MKELTPDISKLHPPGSIEKQYKQMKNDLKAYWGKEPDSLNPEKVEEVSCSLCNSPPLPISPAMFIKFHFPYLRCPLCGLVYLSPRPKNEYLKAQYINGRFSNSFQEIYLPSAEYRMDTIFRERVEEIIMPRVPSGQILDVGCSSGHFLKVAHEHGYDVYGLEPNPKMARFASEELKLPNILPGFLKGHEYPSDYFDVVTIWDVLEHVTQPDKLLHAVYKLLKSGGWVFAYTENVDSFNVFITGSDSEIFAPDVHLRHYSPETFMKEFEKAGFLVQDVMTKGLDIQHIQTTMALNPHKYPKELKLMWKHSDEWQTVINTCGKGDNLRLFAQKVIKNDNPRRAT